MAQQLGQFRISLDARGVQVLLDQGSILGLMAMGDSAARVLGFHATEDGLGDEPRLIVTYRTPGGADFDGDGGVDNEDLALWRGSFGNQSVDHGGGDADGDKDADGADFLQWQRELRLSTSPSGAAPAPESSTIRLVILAIAMTRGLMNFQRAPVSRACAA
jgi:hypothetical protein